MVMIMMVVIMMVVVMVTRDGDDGGVAVWPQPLLSFIDQ